MTRTFCIFFHILFLVKQLFLLYVKYIKDQLVLLMYSMYKKLYHLLDILFPPYCFWCNTEGRYICATCTRYLQPHPDQCGFCHRASLYGITCPDCYGSHKVLKGIMVAFVYTDIIKHLIVQLKFYHSYTLASFLWEKLSLLIQTNPYILQALHSWTLYISYIPSHRRKKRFIKGYNQSELLAEKISSTLQVPCLQAIKKVKYTRSQVSLSRKQRLTNLIGVFTHTVSVHIPPDSTLLIIDDITTTGSTLEQVATVRKRSYPTLRIRWVVVGRHGR